MQMRRLPGDWRSTLTKVPFLSLHGKYGNPLEALKDYYETKVEVYFVGIYPVEEGEINGMDFCRLLSSSTRVIFITDTDTLCCRMFPSGCVGLSAGRSSISPRFSSLSAKRHAGSLCRIPVHPAPNAKASVRKRSPKVIYMRCDNRIMRLDLERINYIERYGRLREDFL